MKNKKGFTIIELGVSICLVTIVSFLLFQMITSVKKIYSGSDLKTTLLTKQAIMIKKINDEFNLKTVSTIAGCDQWQNSCLEFIFTDASTSKLIVDPLKHNISYNNYTIDYEELDEDIAFGELTFNKYTDFFSINIPITTPNLNGDYGINITKQHTNTITNTYDETHSNITIPLSNKDGIVATTTITSDGTNYWLRAYDASNSTLNTLIAPEFKHLKLETCSNTALSGKVYELKTGQNTSRWCQTNNMYTQNVGSYQYISGTISTSLSKDTYASALTNSGVLQSTTLDVKVNEFIERYTFKAR